MVNDRLRLGASYDRLADNIRAARSHPLAAVTALERRGTGYGVRVLPRLLGDGTEETRGAVSLPPA
jgi:hypothetical protein